MSDSKSHPRPVVLCILDGWGLRAEREWNAIAQANTPNWLRLVRDNATARIGTSGRDVGLPDGQMGNSEVGHMNIGAGRIAVPELPRIDNAVLDGSLATAPALLQLIAALKASGGTLHLAGLLSPGGVHSHQDHLAAVARTVAAAGVPVAIHAYLDGRDTPPRSALEYLAAFRTSLGAQTGITFATVIGRYFAMDRDKRWDRVSLAYVNVVLAQGDRAPTAAAAVAQAYAGGQSDEFVKPTVIGAYTDWHPLVGRPGFFPEDIDTSDPWQFRNVLVRSGDSPVQAQPILKK